ncbi:hypothetical protein C3L33_02072, partial [Rhododendron williamsianum]
MNNQDEFRNYQNNHNHSNQSNSNSGLLRFRSAPSSLLSNFNSVGTDYGEKSSSPENVMMIWKRASLLQMGIASALPNCRRSTRDRAILVARYASLRSFGNYRVGNGTNDGDVSPSSSRLRSPMNFSPGVPSSLGMLSQISELEEKVSSERHEAREWQSGASQTNTADMLDLAVDYIKDLQKQYKILNEYRANCKCSSIQKAFANLSA